MSQKCLRKSKGKSGMIRTYTEKKDCIGRQVIRTKGWVRRMRGRPRKKWMDYAKKDTRD